MVEKMTPPVLSVKAPLFIPGTGSMTELPTCDSALIDQSIPMMKKVSSDIKNRFEEAGLNHQAQRNEEEEGPDVDQVIENLKARSQQKKREGDKLGQKRKIKGNLGDILKKPLTKFDNSGPQGNFKSWRNYNNVSAKATKEEM